MIDENTRFAAKLSYLRGLVAGQHWSLKTDEKARFMVHICDQDGKDLSGAKTVQAAIDFVKEHIDQGKE